MSELRQFSERYYHVKKQVENLEEVRFAHVTKKYSELSLEAQAIKEEGQRAVEQRNSGQTGADWLMWQRYVQLLKTLQDGHEKNLMAVGVERDEQQKNLRAAHIERNRWETLTGTLARDHRIQEQRLEERRADEMAILRVNKGGQ